MQLVGLTGHMQHEYLKQQKVVCVYIPFTFQCVSLQFHSLQVKISNQKVPQNVFPPTQNDEFFARGKFGEIKN